jgi:hypothetical protein
MALPVDYNEQMRAADANFAAAANKAGSTPYHEQRRAADANFASAANQAGRAAGWNNSNPNNPWTSPWGSEGLPNWQAPGNTERVYATAPQYMPTEAPQAWDQTKGSFASPGRTENTTDALLEKMLKSPPNFANNTQGEYDRFSGVRPDISADAGLGPYYENAKRRAAESINNAMGARGAYGSSAANDMLSEAFTNLEAERANREADYNLQSLGEQRAWEGLGGNLAGAADATTLSNIMADANLSSMIAGIAQTGDAAEMDRLKTYLNTSFGLDQQQSDMLMRMLTGATAADTQALGRGDRAFDATLGMGGAISGVMGQDYQPGFQSDQDLFQSYLESMYGPKYAELMGSEADKQRIENDFQRFLDLMGEVV